MTDDRNAPADLTRPSIREYVRASAEQTRRVMGTLLTPEKHVPGREWDHARRT